jgi:hypothetical protein
MCGTDEAANSSVDGFAESATARGFDDDCVSCFKLHSSGSGYLLLASVRANNAVYSRPGAFTALETEWRDPSVI